MLYYTHLAFGFLLGLLFMPDKLLFVMIGSMLPDIDIKNSKINQKLGFTKIVTFFCKHRGICHTVWFAMLMFFLFSLVLPRYAFAIALGIVSHLIMDAITVTGVNFFTPFNNLQMKGFIKTGSIFEVFVFLILVAIIIFRVL